MPQSRARMLSGEHYSECSTAHSNFSYGPAFRMWIRSGDGYSYAVRYEDSAKEL